ncbi:MAG: DUF2062 domain-containing protein [Lentisphaeria bacterium]
MRKWQKKWHGWQETIKSLLHHSWSHRIFGARIFHYHIWTVNTKTLAGGLALGLFIAFTPTIPFQMLLCVTGALILRVNLPIALAACWITNPLTALPIYIQSYRVGRFLLHETKSAALILDLFEFESKTGRFMEQSLYLWSGSLIFSTTFAVAGYLFFRLAAMVVQKLICKNVQPANPNQNQGEKA